MSNGRIDSNALKSLNVTFTNGALQGLKYGSTTVYKNGAEKQELGYVANLKNGGLFNSVPVFTVYAYNKQQNGVNINKVNDSKYEFTKLSNARVSLDKDIKHNVKDISLFGCKDVSVEAQDGQAEQISIRETKDSKSNVAVKMDKGDVLYDYTRGVKITAKGNVNYFQHEDNGYQINTELPDGRIKIEIHDGDGNTNTYYYGKGSI